MKKILKSLLCAAIVSISMLQNCSAFFLGSDAYTKEEYETAGITWKHNIILPDKYYYNGKSISQSEAEKIVKDHINALNLETDRELDYILLTILYIDFIKNEKKNIEAQIKELESIYEKINKKISHCTNLKEDLKSQIMGYIQELTNEKSKAS